MCLEDGIPPVPENFIATDVADMDFRCAPCIKDAVMKVAEHNLYGYTSIHPSMAPDYYNAIISWNRRRYGWEINPYDIFYANGTLTAITHCLKAFTEAGDGILILTPVYTPFYATIRDAGRTVVKSPMHNNEGYYTVDWENFEQQASSAGTKAFLLCSPHNPVGRVWTPEELKKMYDICQTYVLIVIVDEIHADIVRKDITFTPMAKIVSGKNLAICGGANKSFNLAALGASHMVISDPEMKQKMKTHLGLVSLTPFVIAATTAAYSQGEEWFDQLRDYLDGNINLIINFMKENMPRVKMCRPEGTYLVWMDFSAYGLDDDEIYTRCMINAGVGIEQGRDFDEGGSPGYVRMVTAIQRPRLKEALERIKAQFEI